MNNIEIEKKWRVKELPEDLDNYEMIEMEQAYLNEHPTVRIRRENDDYVLTYKGISDNDIAHSEYNLPLTKEAFEHMLPKHDGRIIRKKRYVIPLNDHADTDISSVSDKADGYCLKAELDIFDEPFAPLIVVEVEFPSMDAADSFIPPVWFGEEVTHDIRFKNAVMAIDPDFNPKAML
ncbi:MAG: CYTH domain-containing protein [Lachnospiraceae bacterium]|nr:CYTH domain-containing protein [Lachnospiraceae bacterium]